MLTSVTAEPEFVTVPEVARLLRCSKPTVYRRISSGEIPAVRLGAEFGPLRIRRDELDDADVLVCRAHYGRLPTIDPPSLDELERALHEAFSRRWAL